jgi:hypothetical protein
MTAFHKESKTCHKQVSGSIEQQEKSSELESKERRMVIRKLAIGTAALAGCSLLPDKWTTPLVEFGALPAHATTSGTVPAEAADPAPSPPPTPAAVCSSNFSLIFLMTYQSCDSCGIWFDSARLDIVYDGGTFSSSQTGSLLIKKSPSREGRFAADLSSIPCTAAIQSATLYMNLNRDEGIANGDSTSVISVYENSGGNRGGFIRTITAAGDIKGKGYSKANPVVPVDFTDYARQIHGM